MSRTEEKCEGLKSTPLSSLCMLNIDILQHCQNHKITLCQRALEHSMLNIKRQHRVHDSKIRLYSKVIDTLTHALKFNLKKLTNKT